MAARRRSNWHKPIWDRECDACGGCLSGERFARRPGQRDGECSPVPLDTLHSQLSGVRSHNFLHDVQSQPGPPGLGRIQRLKNPLQLRGRHATPRILHLGGRALAYERQPPALGHGVERVLHEIQHCPV
jgi:hypothetical protein